MAEEEYYDDYAEEQIDETYWQETDEQAQEEVVGYNEEAGGLGIEEDGYGGGGGEEGETPYTIADEEAAKEPMPPLPPPPPKINPQEQFYGKDLKDLYGEDKERWENSCMRRCCKGGTAVLMDNSCHNHGVPFRRSLAHCCFSCLVTMLSVFMGMNASFMYITAIMARGGVPYRH